MGEKTKKIDGEKGMEPYFFRASAEDFSKIPGSPIAYWVGSSTIDAFTQFPTLDACGHACSGVQTGDNDLYLRQWYEVNKKYIGFGFTSIEDAENSEFRWFPHKKGGTFRRWYGNCDYVVDWGKSGLAVKRNPSSRPQNTAFWFQEAVTWSHTSSTLFSARYSESGFSFNVEGPSYFSENTFFALAYFCSAPALYFMQIMNPTLHFLVGSVSKLPIIESGLNESVICQLAKDLIEIGRTDWNSNEYAWGFSSLPILKSDLKHSLVSDTYTNLRSQWLANTLTMQRLEEENNRTFIDAYGLQEEITPEVPLNEITLTCNPHYRFGSDKSEAELEALLLADTLREFISYAIGCMFGRYSLDKEGLILANQGDTLENYLKQIASPSFKPDNDNVIPLIDFEGDWFEDDISERFKQFLKVTFGEEHFVKNLAFIEEAIGKDIKKFFLKDFYTDHVKRYKKRPIYWLFSSPKGSFNALIYMHRYRSDTASIVLNDYLREFRTKLTARKQSFEQVGISASASQKEKTQAIKTIEKINKVLDEINDYEHDTLYPLATQQIEIDLDDGVKHNYPLFAKALKKIAGLS